MPSPRQSMGVGQVVWPASTRSLMLPIYSYHTSPFSSRTLRNQQAFLLSTIRSNRPSPSQSMKQILAASGLSADAVVQAQKSFGALHNPVFGAVERAVRAVEDAASGAEQQLAVGRAETFVIGEVTFLIENDEVRQAVAVPVHGHRRRAPLRDERAGFRRPPVPCGFGRFALPSYAHGLCRSEFQSVFAAEVAEPFDFAPDRVDDDVGASVAVPVGHGEHRVAPFALGGSLYGACLSGLYADGFAVDGEELRGIPHGVVAARKVADESDLPGRVPGNDVLFAVAVPVVGAGG